MKVKTIKTPSGIEKQKFIFLENIPEKENDVFVRTNVDMTLDKLALQYYGDESKWRVIALANNLKTIYPPDGIVIRIPINPSIKFSVD